MPLTVTDTFTVIAGSPFRCQRRSHGPLGQLTQQMFSVFAGGVQIAVGGDTGRHQFGEPVRRKAVDLDFDRAASSTPSSRSGVSATPITATRASSTPDLPRRIDTAMLASAKSPKRRATSSNAQPSCCRIGNSISVTISSGSRQFVRASTKKSSRCDRSPALRALAP